jgi:ABC-2 type transport system ATP-binding protein
MAFLEFDKLSVQLAGKPVLREISCKLEARAIGLLGPNGAGKSTLIRTILGFHRPDSGRGLVFGQDVATEGQAIRTFIGYMPENDAFIAGMTAIRFVRYMAELHGLPPGDATERAHEALFWVGLGEARYRKIETFSLGMKQRVKLAQAIVHGPRLLLLDEPTNGLDPPGRAQMLQLIRELQANDDVCVMLSSHLLRDVESVSDHVLILRDGRLVADSNLKADRASQRRFVELELEGDRDAFLRVVHAMGLEHAPGLRDRIKMVLPPGTPHAAIFQAAAKSGGVIRRLVQRRDTLEDKFLQAMGLDPAELAGVRP